jgi:hypothetical protein
MNTNRIKARLEKDSINVYNEKNELIGGIIADSKFKNSEINIGENKYLVSRKKWKSEILENGKIINHLKTNSISGNTEIMESDKKITGVWGFKWGTKLIDQNKNILLKIRNGNIFINENKYEIEISNKDVSDLEILTSLYIHLYGSKMKMTIILMISIINGLIIAKILN